MAEPEDEVEGEAFSLSLSDVGKAMDIVSTHEMADPDAIQALREQVLEYPQVGETELVYRLPKGGMDPAVAQAQARVPIPVLVTEDEEVYYERERALIRRMRENASEGPCRVNEENEGKLIVGEPDFLLPRERALMAELMKKRHRAYAFSDEEHGRLDMDKIPMIRIHTVPHEPWNLRGARYPDPDEEKKVVDYLDGKIRTHVADYSSGLYASPWFCFIKPNGTLRCKELPRYVWVLEVLRQELCGKDRAIKEAGPVTETRPFIVETDAGPTALGGVLIQADIKGKKRPLHFESRTLCTSERNYSQFKRETLAVLHCLRIFRNYIFGRRFILRVDPTALAFSLRNYVPSDPTVARWLTYIWISNFELERIPGNKKRADGLSRINWDRQDGEAVEHTPPVDGFLDQDEDIRLHINKWSQQVPSCVGHPIWHAPKGYEQKAELVLKPFEEEDPSGGKDVQWMTKLALTGSHCMMDEVLTIEMGPDKMKHHEELMGGMYLLVNALLHESLDLESSLNPAEGRDTVLESQDDEFEEGEIKEAVRVEEYEGIYLELGLLLSCEMRDRDASHRAQMMRDRYLVRDGHLFVRRKVGNPRRVVCGRNRQIDVIAALHDGIAGGYRGITASYAKISELYYWDGMMEMVGKFCRSCVPCQEQSRLRPGESLYPRLEREVGAVVHLDLLFMPLGDHGYNYIFDAHDNLSGFVDGRAIRTKTRPVLVSCIEEYYLRYPFVREFVMDRGSEFTCQEVQELLSRYGVVANYTTAAHPQANAPVERGHTMPRGGRGTRPPRRPAGALGGHGRHEPYRRARTPVYNDGDIELFMDEFWGHADHMGWIVTQTIERLRGVGRFIEPIAQIRRGAQTRSEVEARMQELRPSSVGPDGRPIRLKIGNADDFIPAFEQFMQDQAILRSEWMITLPLWTRKAKRPLARQIKDMARDWDGYRAHLREAFRQPEPPRPRVERRLKSGR
ncbi:hypothetical protein CBR_g10964 [Chara braunii]|nr:hypothetical protein CBR_g10964 [Chara braunii]|eukprot:GBG72029.1 hypothetical protein CBR_g10964 [Chara braunii]